MIRPDGWSRRNIWEHSQSVLELYERRARGDAEEMDAHAQAAEILAARAAPGDTVLDAGCGTGYFLHALRRREIPVSYYGVDATAAFIRLGRQCLEPFGLAPDRLQCLRLEDVEADMDHVVCINVLSNLDNYHRPLERLLASARKTLILRESLAESSLYSYVRDDYLDAGVDLRVHINHYGRQEILEFIRARGFDAELLTDRRTQGRPELVIGHPHHWTFVVADRRTGEMV